MKPFSAGDTIFSSNFFFVLFLLPDFMVKPAFPHLKNYISGAEICLYFPLLSLRMIQNYHWYIKSKPDIHYIKIHLIFCFHQCLTLNQNNIFSKLESPKWSQLAKCLHVWKTAAMLTEPRPHSSFYNWIIPSDNYKREFIAQSYSKSNYYSRNEHKFLSS